MESTIVFYGTVIFFSNQKGYGFLQWLDEHGAQQKDMFVHYSDIDQQGYKSLTKGQHVSFQIGANNQGVPKAINVRIVP